MAALVDHGVFGRRALCSTLRVSASSKLTRVGVLASNETDAQQLMLQLDLPWLDCTAFLLDSPGLHEDLNFAGVSALVARVDPGFGVRVLLEHLEATSHGDRPVIIVTDEARDAPFCHAFRMGVVDLVPSRKLTERVLRAAFLEPERRPGVLRGNGAFHELEQVFASLTMFRRTGVLDVVGNGRVHLRWGRIDRLEGLSAGPDGRPVLPEGARWSFIEEAPVSIDAEQELPLLEATVEPALPALTPADVDPTKVSLLVVDDDPTVLHLLKESFGRRGFQVRAASGGAEALQALAAQRFDVAVLDLDMPRVDGWSVLGAMHEDARTWDTQVLLFSAHDRFREVLARSGPVSHLAVPKATRLGVLERHVRELVLPRLELDRRLAISHVDSTLLLTGLESIGIQWVLRAFERHGITGALSGRTPLASVTAWFCDGRLVQAEGTSHRARCSGLDALRVLLASRPSTLSLEPSTVPPGEGYGRRSTSAIVSDVVDRLAIEQHLLGELEATQALALSVNEPLLQLLLEVSSGFHRQVAELLHDGLGPTQIADRFAVPLEAVIGALRELVRRGVVRLEHQAGPPVLTRAA